MASGAKGIGEAGGLTAVALNHFGKAVAAKRSHRRIDRHGTGAARLFRHEFMRIPLASRGDNVGGSEGHGAAVRCLVRAEDDAAIVGNVEPFVRISGDGIGKLNPADERSPVRRSRSP
jgi:hypothetical protein